MVGEDLHQISLLMLSKLKQINLFLFPLNRQKKPYVLFLINPLNIRSKIWWPPLVSFLSASILPTNISSFLKRSIVSLITFFVSLSLLKSATICNGYKEKNSLGYHNNVLLRICWEICGVAKGSRYAPDPVLLYCVQKQPSRGVVRKTCSENTR